MNETTLFRWMWILTCVLTPIAIFLVAQTLVASPPAPSSTSSDSGWTAAPFRTAPRIGGGGVDAVAASGLTFSTFRTSAGEYYYSPGISVGQVQATAQAVETADREAPRVMGLGRRPTFVPVYIFSNHTELINGASRLQGESLGPSINAQGLSFAKPWRAPGIFIQLQGVQTQEQYSTLVTHEYTHQYVADLTNGNHLTAWYEEGLAEYVANLSLRGVYPTKMERELNNARAWVQQAQAQKQVIPLANMRSGAQWFGLGDTSRGHAALIYSEAVVAIDTLARKHGMKRVVDVVLNVGGGQSFDNAFQSAFGSPLARFEADFIKDPLR